MKSMTGFGAARCDVAGYHVVVEAKSVNGRFLKITAKMPSTMSAFESQLEARVKERIRRGSVHISIFLQRTAADALVQVNEDVIRAYQGVFTRLGLTHERFAMLPGVLGPTQTERHEPLSAELMPAISACVEEALSGLLAMRQHEGDALRAILQDLCVQIAAGAGTVRTRAPHVVTEYQHKLHGRLEMLLAGVEGSIDPQQLAREVAVYADRCDVTEEVDRLGAHLQQTTELLQEAGEIGRTLEFLAQEMHREVNTIGSKSADPALSRCVIQLKSDVERFKEQVANVE